MNPVIRSMFTIVDSLERKEILYAVMGGIAVRIHALPRPTQDVDLTISMDRSQLVDWYEELEGMGITVPEIYKNGWIDQIASMPLIKFRTYISPENAIDLDIFLAESEFQTSILNRRVYVDFDAKSIAVVSPEDLILLKLIANRPRDHIDVSDILFIQGELDRNYMRIWAERLKISDRLETALLEARN